MLPSPASNLNFAHERLRMNVLLETSLGAITIQLDTEKAPITSENFAAYANEGFYPGTIFHRVIPNFMIQGGGHLKDLSRKPTRPPIKNEWKNGLKNLRGTIAMARLGGDPDSATSQFFINVVDNGFLDRPQSDGAAYCVFGKVISGMEIVDKIRVVPTGRSAGHDDVPTQTVSIIAVSILPVS
jgi:cyclophilin family peptidyl-prolyl cis-trans isomerase